MLVHRIVFLLAGCRYHIGRVALRRVLTCFLIIADFPVWGKTPLGSTRQICIRFYGDYQYKNTLTADPLPASVIQGLGLDLQTSYISLQYYITVMENTSRQIWVKSDLGPHRL